MAAEPTSRIKTFIKTYAPAAPLRWLQRWGIRPQYTPAPGRVAFGDFDRLRPISKDFGYERGGPIDRYYIEHFLQQQAASIRGRVLEIGGNDYTLQFGGKKVEKSDILHVDDSNPQATYVGDLSNAPHLPDQAFDCIILTQTLHLIWEYKEALKTCYRMLKPGGTFLMTSPGITPIASGAWKEIWYWSFTRLSITRVLQETFPDAELDIRTYGNAYAASAFLWGLGLPEVSIEKLEVVDEQYQVIIAAKAVKPLLP
ncbi:methyltransferase domain-containing protein [Cesiribacter andamanensis]|uniref:Putative S-adenosylmethionine-dependent methyltransferase n=1 Tax=Cesiribacter andamanensis AMV16 TaxID=1279009 RepID=M7NGW6_9BACT|nr:methyltransferase domain-containing protein [Cesiribacter andamanensis]EMR01080.1 putative S-adenosylmethionine-dependent methyltransferase [Cesiribacter andamanensis AMV16]